MEFKDHSINGIETGCTSRLMDPTHAHHEVWIALDLHLGEKSIAVCSAHPVIKMILVRCCPTAE